jgi:hypothetical protein
MSESTESFVRRVLQDDLRNRRVTERDVRSASEKIDRYLRAVWKAWSANDTGR